MKQKPLPCIIFQSQTLLLPIRNHYPKFYSNHFLVFCFVFQVLSPKCDSLDSIIEYCPPSSFLLTIYIYNNNTINVITGDIRAFLTHIIPIFICHQYLKIIILYLQCQHIAYIILSPTQPMLILLKLTLQQILLQEGLLEMIFSESHILITVSLCHLHLKVSFAGYKILSSHHFFFL